jgi:hypothetical protein
MTAPPPYPSTPLGARCSRHSSVADASAGARPCLRETGRLGSVNADRMPFAGGGVYAMTKAAVAGLTRGLARDLGPRGVEEAELLQPGEPFPVGLRFSGQLDPLGRAAEGKEVREFAVEPAGEMPHGGVDAEQRGLAQALPPKLFQEGFGHGDEPLLRVVMAVELVIEGEEASQIAVLGVQGGPGLAGHFSDQVESGQVCQTRFGGFDGGWNVMG